MDSSSTSRHLWLVLSLCAGVIASMAMSGCKTGMLSNAHFPKLGMQNGPFKMLARKNKDQPAPPPSRHFDEGNASGSSVDTQVVIDEPDINAVAALDSSKPSQKRSPTQPESGDESRTANNRPTGSDNPGGSAGGFGFPPNADSIAKNNSTADPPPRKPYQSPSIPGDSLKSAAEALARDMDKSSTDARSRLNSAAQDNANSLSNADALVNSIRGSASDFESNVAQNMNQGASQFTLPESKPQSPPAGDSGEKPRFGFSVPSSGQFENVPGSSQPYQVPDARAQASIQNLNPIPSSSGGSSGFSMPDSSVTLTPLQPRPSAPETGSTSAYPSTPHGQYTIAPSGSASSVSSGAASANSENTVPNSRWSTVTPSDTPPFGSSSAKSGLANSFGLPEVLLQRSGSYAPGSTRVASPPADNTWR